MPQDPNLYGQRPAKKQKHDANLSSSLDFTAQLTSLMSNTNSSKQTSGRPRPSRAPKDDLFRGRKSSKQKKEHESDEKLVLKEVAGTEDEAQERTRAKRNMENKARLYAAMKRGDYIPKEGEQGPLVDFDRKWAEDVEDHSNNETSSDEDDDDDSGEMVEYEDEFGRVRQVTKSEKERLERRAKRGYLNAYEHEQLSARPSAPSNLIYGDAVQSMAFNPKNEEQMEALARKRDRSATPPEMKHYDADHEIRTKGTGFYKFSRDEETRKQEMDSLEEERKKTERQRREREDAREARKKDIERRRKEMAERRARKQADSFLDGLAGG